MYPNDKQNNMHPETDFYTEALKAFEVALPPQELEQKPVLQIPEQQVQETEPPKMTPRPKWWTVAAVALVCLAVLVTFWPKNKQTPQADRSLRGTVAFVGENMMIVLDESGEKWYVDMNGLPFPQIPNAGVKQVWVSYRGDPQPTDQMDCTKRISAISVRDAQSGLLTKYGFVYDQLAYDHNGDGIEEQWLLCSGTTSGVNSFRLACEDPQGNCIYDVTVLLPYNTAYMLNGDGEYLRLIGGANTLDVVVSDSQLQVFYGKEPLTVVDNLHATLPPIGEESAMVQFSVLDLDGGYMISQRGDWITLDAAQGRSLKSRLDGLKWGDYVDETYLGSSIAFTLWIDGKEETYTLDDGYITCGHKTATIELELWEELVQLMGQEADLAREYAVEYGNGNRVNAVFDKQAGTAQLEVWNDQSFLMMPMYGVIGEYLYVLNTGKTVEYSTVMVFRLQEDGSLLYRSALSRLPRSELPEDLILYDASAPLELSFSLTPATSPNMEESAPFRLSATQAERLRQILSDLQWVRGEDEPLLGMLEIQYPVGITQEYLILDGFRLGDGDCYAVLDEKAREFLMNLLIQASGGPYTDMVYRTEEDDLLYLHAGSNFELSYGGMIYQGSYARVGRILYLLDAQGNDFILVEQADQSLKHVYLKPGELLPHGLVFQTMTYDIPDLPENPA